MAQRYFDTSVRRVPVKFYECELVDVGGGRKKAIYTEREGVSLANVKTKGGTPVIIDDAVQIIATATVTITYRPDIKRGDRMECLNDSTMWDILHVENIDMQNRDCVLTVRNVEGL